ncbi:hypothetical protein FNU79_14120 [Deinococcus detaillensis]|uniref:DUF1819 family protein n=1 Tax=Deinococcus detaillensis TaxID=2592048 RepID=A0A553UPJ6_9DEIO|nr:hypothetical protein [Deinococcus detaillensis]TSA82149.1 hypothetical protein FNU79_14120 [Deinococcus detaillensis]
MNSVVDETSRQRRGGYQSVHTGRTMMFGDLVTVLDQGASAQLLQSAVVEGNVLGKKTVRTRKASWNLLNRLYGLSDSTPLMTTFLALWQSALAAQPQLALLRALERDSLLQLSAPWLVALQPGQVAKPADLAAELKRLGAVYSEKTLKSISRNLLSSWTQAGWLKGKVAKRRVDVEWQPAAATYLLYGPYLQGKRGAELFAAPLARLLNLDADQLDTLAFAASQDRLLSYRRLAEVIEITFPNWETSSPAGLA